MTASVSRRPPAPTCEDCWDDDAHGFHAGNRPNPSVDLKWSQSADFDPKPVAGKKNHDGSDSGYSSKAGTSDTMSTASLKKGGDLKIDTNERQRNPYSYAPPRTEEPRMSPTKAKAAKVEKIPKPQPPPRFQHPHGLCWVCDQYGYHFDIEKDIQRPATTAPTHTQRPSKSPAPKARAKDEIDGRPSVSRRSSSMKRDSRPLSMYGGQGPFGFPPHPVDYSHPVIAANGWQTPPQYAPQYSQYQYHHAPPTPVSGTFGQAPGFFDMNGMGFQHTEPYYGEQMPNHYEMTSDKPTVSKKDKDSQRPSRESRSRSATQKVKKTAEAEKMARISMPPPPRPEAVRPIIKKSPTEYVTTTSIRKSAYEDDEYDQLEYSNAMGRSRNTSQSRPPSSYKPVSNAEIQGRPRARKSVSYSTPSGTVQMASSTHREMPRRRTDPLEQRVEQRVADAEDYVANTKNNRYSQAEMEAYVPKPKNRRESDSEETIPKPSRPVVNPLLTTEALRKFEQKDSNTMSETGSVRSHLSSSRESATGRARAGTTVTSDSRSNITSITMNNGISLSIPADCVDYPLDIMLGNLRLSMNPASMGLMREEERPREMKQIEKAPSEISHSSRRSLTSGSAVSVPRERDPSQSMTRPRPSANSSKRQSRAASTNRGDRERASIDYSLLDLDESYYLEYAV